MKIKFLGTAAAESIPAPFCDCNTCKNARIKKGKNIRKRSSVLINNDLLIDCGPDFIWSCSEYDLDMSDLKYLLITHAHFDHWYPENLEIRYNRYLKNRLSDLNIIGNSSVFYKLHQLGYSDKDIKIKRIEGRLYKKYFLEDYIVIPIYANHAHEYGNALNYIIEYNKKTILYACDTGIYSNENFKFLKKYVFDVIIIDSTNLLTKTSENHLNLQGINIMRSKLAKVNAINENSEFICTHFSHTGISNDYETLCNIANDNNLIIAYDGMEITL